MIWATALSAGKEDEFAIKLISWLPQEMILSEYFDLLIEQLILRTCSIILVAFWYRKPFSFHSDANETHATSPKFFQHIILLETNILHASLCKVINRLVFSSGFFIYFHITVIYRGTQRLFSVKYLFGEAKIA